MNDGGPSEGTFEKYKQGKDVPLFSYGLLAGAFNLAFAVFLLAARLTGRSMPERLDVKDIALLGMATHKLSLVGSAGCDNEPLARPVYRTRGEGEPQEGRREAKGRGPAKVRGRAPDVPVLPQRVGGLPPHLRLVLAPRLTRLVAAVFATVTVSDFLHQAYKVLIGKASG